jgi:hypothetical protein
MRPAGRRNNRSREGLARGRREIIEPRGSGAPGTNYRHNSEARPLGRRSFSSEKKWAQAPSAAIGSSRPTKSAARSAIRCAALPAATFGCMTEFRLRREWPRQFSASRSLASVSDASRPPAGNPENTSSAHGCCREGMSDLAGLPQPFHARQPRRTTSPLRRAALLSPAIRRGVAIGSHRPEKRARKRHPLRSRNRCKSWLHARVQLSA